MQFAESGLRPLVLFSKSRNASIPDTPTAMELGVNFTITEPRIWLAPDGIGEAESEKLSEVLAAVVADPAIQEELSSQSIEYEWLSPQDVKAQLDESAARIEPLGEIARNLAKQ
jgi:tripartite-type tricarboxylate transporter receptor subunit TctC